MHSFFLDWKSSEVVAIGFPIMDNRAHTTNLVNKMRMSFVRGEDEVLIKKPGGC